MGTLFNLSLECLTLFLLHLSLVHAAECGDNVYPKSGQGNGGTIVNVQSARDLQDFTVHIIGQQSAEISVDPIALECIRPACSSYKYQFVMPRKESDQIVTVELRGRTAGVLCDDRFTYVENPIIRNVQKDWFTPSGGMAITMDGWFNSADNYTIATNGTGASMSVNCQKCDTQIICEIPDLRGTAFGLSVVRGRAWSALMLHASLIGDGSVVEYRSPLGNVDTTFPITVLPDIEIRNITQILKCDDVALINLTITREFEFTWLKIYYKAAIVDANNMEVVRCTWPLDLDDVRTLNTTISCPEIPRPHRAFYLLRVQKKNLDYYPAQIQCVDPSPPNKAGEPTSTPINEAEMMKHWSSAVALVTAFLTGYLLCW